MPDPIDEEPAPRAVRRPRWQFGLRSMLAITALVAVWFSYFENIRQIPRIEAKIDAIRLLARELVVDDPSRFALLKLDSSWYDENRWELHVPEGSFLACLATRGVDERGLPVDRRSAPIPPGRHILELRQSSDGEERRAMILVDGTVRIEAVEPKGWNPEVGATTVETDGGAGEQSPADGALVMFRRRFLTRDASGGSSIPVGPCDGLLIWIEPAAPPPSAGPGGS